MSYENTSLHITARRRSGLLSLPIFAAALLAVSPSLATNRSDVDALYELDKAGTSLEGDIIESAKALNVFGKSSQEQLTCLFDIKYALTDITAKLDAISDLAFLAAVMDDPGDERRINSLLAVKLPHELQLIALARTEVLHSAAHCSTSALVNIYAQKTAALADKTTTAINAIYDRAASVH